MKKLLLSCLGLLGLLGAGMRSSPPASPRPPVRARKVVFIIADGIPADVLTKARLPTVGQLSAAGSYLPAYVGGELNTYTQTPTISAPGYMDLLTGTWGYKHNVWDNDVKAPNYQYPNIFRLLKQVRPASKIGIFSTWLDNRTKLVGEGRPEAGNVRFDYHADGYELDTVTFRHDKLSQYTHAIDDTVVAAAARCLRRQAPDLSWIYLEHTDDMGHRYGDSPQQQQALRYLDAQLARVWAALRYRTQHYPEDWLLILTTDHGRDAVTGRDHGGQSARERATWLVLTTKDLNAYARRAAPAAIVDVLPTVARFLQLPLPRATQRELDGVPLIGPVSVAGLQLAAGPDSLRLRWTALGARAEKVSVWLTATNHYKTGGPDAYTLLGTVPLARQRAAFSRAAYPAAFYKIVLEGQHNTVNRWLLPAGAPTP